jgi:hypothetical protein
MKITRRAALLGAAGGMIGGLPIITHASPVHPLSPLLPLLKGHLAGLLRRPPYPVYPEALAPFDIARYYNGNQTQPFDSARYYSALPVMPPLEHYVVDSAIVGRSVESVFEAEDILLNYVPAIEYQLPRLYAKYGPYFFPYGVDEYAAPAILLNRQCNLIAARTRHGCGNLALMHPETFDEIIRIQSCTSAFADINEQPPVGRWNKMGVLNNTLTLYTSDHMPAMEVVIMYRGTKDTINGAFHNAGAVLLDHDDRLTLIDDVGNPNLMASSVANYISRVRFTHIPA